MKKYILIFTLALVGVFFFKSEHAHALLPNFTNQLVTAGLSLPTDFAFTPDGRMLMTQQGGKVVVFKNNSLLAAPALTLTPGTGGDRGLISLALDPNFSSNGFVYLLYTSSTLHERISKFTMSGDTINPATEVVLLENPKQWGGFLNAGALRFGPDGKLYASLGSDGGGNTAQDVSTLEGKMVRINADGSIPGDNPFFNFPGAHKAVYAFGLRNPWRFNFAPDGKLILGDVGESSFEKIVRIQSGANYGWPAVEGDCRPNCGSFTPPLLVTAHNGQGMAVVGGDVVKGSNFPASLSGMYFFGDYVQGTIQYFGFDASGNATGLQNFDSGNGTLADMVFGPDGCLWYLTIFPGELHKICFGGSQQVLAKATSDKTFGALPLTVNFSSSGSTGTGLSYAWNFGDGSATSTLPNPSHAYTQKGIYTGRLTVTGSGGSSSANITIWAGYTPPNLQITAPATTTRFSGGSALGFSATATSSDGQSLPASSFFWQVIFHHNTHIHPPEEFPGIKSGSFTVPTHLHTSDVDLSYEFKLTVTDSVGLATTESRFVTPNLINLSVNSNPTGLQLLLDDQPIATPYQKQAIPGYQRTLGAPSPQTLNGLTYTFSSWSDGGAQNHGFTEPAVDTTYTANFTASSSTPPGTCPAPATGAFTGCYYKDINFSTFGFSRTDPNINFDFAGGSPGPGVPADNFSVRWQGNFSFSAGTTTFTTTADDGVRIYIDGVLALDKFIDQPPTTYTFAKNLTAGTHAVRMDYYEKGGGAVAKLSWVQTGSPPAGGTLTFTDTITPASPSFTPGAAASLTASVTATQNVPNVLIDLEIYNSSGTKILQQATPANLIANQPFPVSWNFTAPAATGTYTVKLGVFQNDWSKAFFWHDNAATFTVSTTAPPPPPGSCPAPVTDAFTGCYYKDKTFTTFGFSRTDASINFDFAGAGPGSGIPADGFSVRWQGNFSFNPATYTFTATADDGIRVFVDGTVIIDKFIDQPATTYTATLPLGGGTHTVKVDYYENTGNAVAKVSWAQNIVPPPPPPPGGIFAVSASMPATNFPPGSSSTITTNVTSSNSIANAFIHTEVYNSSGTKVLLRVVSTSLVANQQFTSLWQTVLPAASGTYTIKIGVFSSDYTQLYFWNNNAFQFTVGTPPSDPVPGVTYPIHVLVPADNASVSGLVEIRAVIDNLNINSYNIGWRTGTGAYFNLDTDPVTLNFKHAWIDFSTWTWNANHIYPLEFQATNLSGGTIGHILLHVVVN